MMQLFDSVQLILSIIYCRYVTARKECTCDYHVNSFKTRSRKQWTGRTCNIRIICNLFAYLPVLTEITCFLLISISSDVIPQGHVTHCMSPVSK